MTKVLLGFQLIVSSLIHLLCCGLPLLISVSSGLSIFMALQTFTPILLGLQFIVFGLTFYQLYKPSDKAQKSIRHQRIIFWLITFVSFVMFFYPPVHWFKSEESRLKKEQMERFLKHKL